MLGDTLLADLPPSDTRRTTSLAGCMLRNKQSILWRRIEPQWAIAKVTYNDLTPAWTDTADFAWPDAHTF